MAKAKTIYFCQECGHESAKWMGQCPGCKQWNTFVEETVERRKGAAEKKLILGASPVILADIEMKREERFTSGFPELDRVLGGGIVPASLVLVGGDPGIGKSTLLLQVCQKLSAQQIQVLYISGEESLQQIKIRAQRIGSFTDSLFLLCETNHRWSSLILFKRCIAKIFRRLRAVYHRYGKRQRLLCSLQRGLVSRFLLSDMLQRRALWQAPAYWSIW